MNDSMFSDQGSRCYEQLRVMDDMNDLGSLELQSLDVLNISRLRMIWMIFCREPMMLNVINNSRMWFNMNNSRCELRALDVMNISRLWLICMSWAHGYGCYELLRVMDGINELRSCKLKPLGAMNISWLWMIWTILGHEHKALNVMNN